MAVTTKQIINKVAFSILRRLQQGRADADLERILGRLKYRGKDLDIDPDVSFYGPDKIEIGSCTKIRSGSRIQTSSGYPPTGQVFHPIVVIGERCSIEFRVHVSVCHYVEIGNDVTIASGVYIADHQHRYDDPTKPVIQQPITESGRVVIGNGSFVGTGSCIFSNVILGEHVVVGANSVVTKDVPPFCVVAGAPARILRHYDFQQQKWVAGTPNGESK